MVGQRLVVVGRRPPMPTPGYATTGPIWPEGNDKITPVEEQVKTPLANYEDIINNHQVICVKYRGLFYDDDYIFKAKLLNNVIIPHATLKSRDFDQITSYRP
jgi:hypothetical protein